MLMRITIFFQKKDNAMKNNQKMDNIQNNKLNSIMTIYMVNIIIFINWNLTLTKKIRIEGRLVRYFNNLCRVSL